VVQERQNTDTEDLTCLCDFKTDVICSVFSGIWSRMRAEGGMWSNSTEKQSSVLALVTHIVSGGTLGRAD